MFKGLLLKYGAVIILIVSGLIFINEVKNETNRVNAITEEYMNLLTKNAWFIGCAQGTDGDFVTCREISDKMDFPKLKKALDEIDESTN